MELLEWLNKPGVGAPAPERWRARSVERWSVGIGFRKGILGGPYEPLSVRRSREGDVYVEWAGGVTRSTLNRSQLEDAEATLPMLWDQRRVGGPREWVPATREPAHVHVHSEEVERLVLEEPQWVRTVGDGLLGRLLPAPTENVRGTVLAEVRDVAFATSEATRIRHRETLVTVTAELGGIASVSAAWRGVPDDEEAARRVEHLKWVHEILTRERVAPAPVPIFACSQVAERLLAFFLLKNLDMEAVLDGTSAFSREQAAGEMRLFDASLSILDDATRDGRAASYCLDERGLPPERRHLIEGGRLVGMDVSPRAAMRAMGKATPVTMPKNLILETEASRASMNERSIPETLGDAILVEAVLGLNTQDPISGSYSLSVPQALLIRDGEVVGPVAGRLSGSFLRDLELGPACIRDPLGDLPILSLPSATFSAG